MKPVHFIYSHKQRAVSISFELSREVNKVFINGVFIPYTEINDTGNSNWEDAQHLGIHPSGWVMCNGVIQDSDLAEFIKENK